MIDGPAVAPVDPTPDLPPTVRETATVTVSAPVDGTKRRRKKSADQHRPHRKVRAVDTHEIAVDPRVMEVARPLVTPNTKLVIVSPECVRIVNR